MVNCRSRKQKSNKENWDLIYKMKKRTSKKKRGKKFSDKNKETVLYLIEAANDLYKIRDKVIAVFEKKRIGRAKF